MTRADSQTAYALDAPGVPARFGFGTATTTTDGDGDTMVQPDGVPEVAAGVAEVEEEEGVQIEPDPNQPDEPLPMLTVCGPVSEGERVCWVSLGSGSSLVIGSLGGQMRLLGGSLISGGYSDISESSADETEIVELGTEVEVPHPDHLIVVHTFMDVVNEANAAAGLIGRIYRSEESEEGDVDTVEVGRFLRHSAVAAGATYGQTRPVPDTPEPGSYTYTATMRSNQSAGWTVLTAPTSSTPLYSAGLWVYDCGPLPEWLAVWG